MVATRSQPSRGPEMATGTEPGLQSSLRAPTLPAGPSGPDARPCAALPAGPSGPDAVRLGPPAVLAQAATENFPVAMRLLPAHVRRHLMAVYGFARLTDDIGDEAEGDRLGLLAWLDDQLERAAAGQADHPLLQEVGASIRELGLPLQPFRDLIEANRQDQLVRRYATFDDLAAYCMLSAAPVGRLVLTVLGLATDSRVALSDDVCVGLQLVEHLQDVGEDAARDRVYLPQEDLRRLGCDDRSLLDEHASPELRRLVAFEAGRAHRLLRSGLVLARTLPPRARVAVCGFTAGGMAAIDAMERAGFDVLGQACRPRPRRFAWRLASALGASLGLAAP